ncbi:MAG: pilus assembly PilX N-terminal domain-containing protein [Trueperaceae bacterium]
MSNKGFALVTMLMVVSVVGILTAGSLILSVTNLRLSRNDATASQALAVAQAGSAYWRAELVSLYMYMIDNFDDYADDIDAYNENNPDNQIACGNFLAIGVDTDRDGSPDVSQNEWLPEIAIPVGGVTGKARVKFYTRGSAIVLDSQATVNGARGRMVDEFRISAIDMWNNAVFAGNSAASAVIQGRAEIRGSVHVLGEGLTSTEKALDLSGSFALGNTYRNLNASIDPTGSDNPMRLTTKDPTDLCATLRVKRGYVQLGGSGQIGFPEDENPEPFMDPLRGVFTNDGIQGGTLDSNVFSENGMTAAYDAGDSFKFPYLDNINPETNASWRDGMSNENALRLSKSDLAYDDRNRPEYQGVTEENAAHEQLYLTPGCFDDHELNSGGLFGVNQAGDTMEVFKDNGKSSYKAEGFVIKWGHSSSPPTPSFKCAKKRKNAYGTDETLVEAIWDGANNEMYVGGTKGVVVFRGNNLLFTGPASSGREIGYRGNGIFFTEDADGKNGGSGGSHELEFDFVPADGNAAVSDEGGGAEIENASSNPYRVKSSTRKNSYPATSVLALVADRNVFSAGAQQRFTVALFAEGYVYMTKQTLVVGSIVSRAFHAGSQVPTVLYVPNLAERLSDLLPGAGGTSFAVSNVAFSRR